jgi:hypothetical protein
LGEVTTNDHWHAFCTTAAGIERLQVFLTVLIFPTEIVLSVLRFPSEIVLAVLIFLTEIVLPVLRFPTNCSSCFDISY